MRTKALSLFLAIFSCLILFRTPILRAGFMIQWWYLSTVAKSHHGLYNSMLDEYHCDNLRSCLHEQGHSKDRNLGWYSNTSEFQETIAILSNCEPRLPKLPYIQFTIREVGLDNPQETYAIMYSLVNPDISFKELLEDYANQCNQS